MNWFIRGVFFVGIFNSFVFSQVLNTASVLRQGSFSLCIAPVLFADHSNDLGIYFAGGFGISRDIDIGIKVRFQDYGRTYFGADVEFGILKGLPDLSLGIGAHSYNKVGLDATLNITFPIRRVVSVYSGVDFDVEFRKSEQDFLLWVPVGVEVMLRQALSIIIEIDISIIEPAPNMFALGLNIFL